MLEAWSKPNLPVDPSKSTPSGTCWQIHFTSWPNIFLNWKKNDFFCNLDKLGISQNHTQFSILKHLTFHFPLNDRNLLHYFSNIYLIKFIFGPFPSILIDSLWRKCKKQRKLFLNFNGQPSPGHGQATLPIWLQNTKYDIWNINVKIPISISNINFKYQFQIPNPNTNSKYQITIPNINSNNQFQKPIPNEKSKYQFQKPKTNVNSKWQFLQSNSLKSNLFIRSWTSNSSTTLNQSSASPMIISQGFNLSNKPWCIYKFHNATALHCLNRDSRHRALNLVNLSTSLSGIYSCRFFSRKNPNFCPILKLFRVSSNHGDSFESKSLTIFCKLSDMMLFFPRIYKVLVAPYPGTHYLSSFEQIFV